MTDLQLAALFPYFPILFVTVILLLTGIIDWPDDNDDDGPDKGIMIPAYASNS